MKREPLRDYQKLHSFLSQLSILVIAIAANTSFSRQFKRFKNIGSFVVRVEAVANRGLRLVSATCGLPGDEILQLKNRDMTKSLTKLCVGFIVLNHIVRNSSPPLLLLYPRTSRQILVQISFYAEILRHVSPFWS